ncbi:hypothetical protein A9995_09345 [Erythrobacter sp. QSSC1-22B]|uniref:hypothetical protein n=1 Tax=Erythrobacter sp. QSSC1-22B TaxID=1860125 RepID=UPI000804B81B|nr:hypothetical protein [Erythrobacter sp. QSSC1-22B]OBX18768.1 hypothetical protein A9995_09345 [Erythrobacter sp. QSSC1-22B]
MIRIAAAIAATGVLLAGCAPTEGEDRFVSEAPMASVTGDPVNCLNTAMVRQSRVHDDRTIDFEVGSRTYRNTLGPGCGGLGFEKSFTYRTSINRLCSGEIIYVLRTIGGQLDRGAACSLGEFVPIEYVDRDIDTMRH